MKTPFLILSLLLCAGFAFANNMVTDSLKKKLQSATSDTSRVLIYADLSDAFVFSSPDSSLNYAQKGLLLSQAIGFKKGEARCIYENGVSLWITGNYSHALELLLKSLEMREQINDQEGISKSLNVIGIVYIEQQEYEKGLEYYFRSKAICEAIKRDDRVLIALLNIGDAYEKLNMLDSALLYEEQAYALAIRTGNNNDMDGLLNNLGNIHSKMGNDEIAISYYRKSIPYSSAINNNKILSESYFGISNLFRKGNKLDSCIHYAHLALSAGLAARNPMNIMNASTVLSSTYEETNVIDSAFRYYKLAIISKDSIFSEEQVKKVQALSFAEQLRQEEIAAAKRLQQQERENNLQMFAMGIFIITFLLFVFFLSRRRIKPKVIEFTGLLGLLLMFEFLSLLIHPFILHVTDHNYILMLLILVCIAAVLVPIHHTLIKIVREKLAHKPSKN